MLWRGLWLRSLTGLALPDVHPAGGDAFDPLGDLWVANAATLVEFNRQELAKVIDGARTPDDRTVAPEPPSGPAALGLLWAYFQEMVSRYQLRPGRPDEVEGAMAEDPSDNLVPFPPGIFSFARRGSTPVGCIGLRLRPNQVGQVTRVFVLPAERRKGVGATLMAEIEAAARDHGSVGSSSTPGATW